MFLPYMGVLAILVMWPRCRKQTFVTPSQEAPHKFGFDWPSGFGGKDVWKCERTDGRQMPDHGYTISSPMSLGSGVLKSGATLHGHVNMMPWAASHSNWKSPMSYLRFVPPVCLFQTIVVKQIRKKERKKEIKKKKMHWHRLVPGKNEN